MACQAVVHSLHIIRDGPTTRNDIAEGPIDQKLLEVQLKSTWR